MIALLPPNGRKRALGRRPVTLVGEALPPGALAVSRLMPDGCRWPTGEVHEEGFCFCNERRVRGSYCARHASQAAPGSRR